MSGRAPQLDPGRLAERMGAAIDRLELDLTDRTVVTEAATGPYVVTPVLAALAGARRVEAVARDSCHGTAAEAATLTGALARTAGVADRLELVPDKCAADLDGADIVTNSGHLRPLDGGTIERMHPGAAIPLMYESWELRAADVDLEACRRRGIRVAGTNERHPAVDVFSFLGPMAVRLLTDAGLSVKGSRLLLLCDNPFRADIQEGLEAAGAELHVSTRLGADWPDGCDAVVVALRPGPHPVLSERDACTLGERAPGTLVAQFWGDLPRLALRAAGVRLWPRAAPAPGHMGILPSALGSEPIVRLQAAGLKVGEVLCREESARRPGDLDYVQLL